MKPVFVCLPGFFISISILLVPNIAENLHLSSHGENLLKLYWKIFSTTWPKYGITTYMLQELENNFPEICQLYSIGKTVQGREMWVLKLGADVGERPLLVPQVKIVANMHGDETLGRALVLMFAVDILTKFFQGDVRARNLLQTTELHLMPSMNVDGFEAAPEGECSPDPHTLGRVNANLKDLNRDFPDQFETHGQALEDLYRHREPETINVMKWITSNNFVLSANLHALTLVASYPFDSVSLEQMKKPDYQGFGVISHSPDHDLFFQLATLYATSHKWMSKYNNCSQGQFQDGVVNGAEWYNVRGGMQDFNYIHSNTFEVTFELSCCKFPPAYALLGEWENNHEALYSYVEAAQWGIKGLIQDENGNAVKNAKIHVEDIDHVVTSTGNGEYWRLLLPGKYDVWVEAQGYEESAVVSLEVPKKQGMPVRQDFTLYEEEGTGYKY